MTAEAVNWSRAEAAEEIRQAVLRYCRGVDRLDPELMFSAYHEDATDDHGVFVGSARELCDRVAVSHRRYDSTMHCVLNHAIEFADATHAVGEAYVVSYLLGGGVLDTFWGRYLDDYECRDGRWAITRRVCVHEFTSSRPLGDPMPIDTSRFRSGRDDRRFPAET